MTKISELPAASTVASTDSLPVVQGGTTKQAPLSVLAAFLGGASGAVNAVTSALVTRRRPTTFTGWDPAAADNTSAINTSLAAMQPYDTWVVPQGQFKHSGKLLLPYANPKATILSAGLSSELVATNPDQATFTVAASDTTLGEIRHTVLGATSRGGGQNQDTCPWYFTGKIVNSVLTEPLSGVNVSGLISTGAKDAGFFVFGVSGMKIRGVKTEDSFADGMHLSYNTSDIDVADCVMNRPGDDGLAVVSYANEGLCRNIRARNIKVYDSGARGVSVVGGDNIDYDDISVFRSRAAAVYIATEVGAAGSGSSNFSREVSNVDVSNVVIEDPCWGYDQGAILILNQLAGNVMRNVRVRGFRAGGMRSDQSPTQSSYVTVKNGNGQGGATSSGGRFTGLEISDGILAKGTSTNLPGIFADGTNSTTVTKGGVTYGQLTAQASGGTFVQGDEGTVLYNAAGNLGTSTSTASAPDITIRRVSVR